MIKIIGCGNILRQDDGIGIYVIQELKKIPLSKDIELIDFGTRGLDMLSFLEGAQRVIIVDGVKSQDTISPFHLPRCNIGEMSDDSVGPPIGASEIKLRGAPGDIYHVNIDIEDIDTNQSNFISTHEFNWEHILSLGKEILQDRFPKKVTFWGIEIENMDPGLGLSPGIKEVLPKVVHYIQKELEGEKDNFLLLKPGQEYKPAE